MNDIQINKPDILVSLDLSFDSSGIAVFDRTNKQLYVTTITPMNYFKGKWEGQYTTVLMRAVGISEAILRLLYKYRHGNVQVCSESIAYGLKFRRSLTDLDLLMMQGIVVADACRLFEATPKWVMPKAHKRAFTGDGKADKAKTVGCLLHFFPQLAKVFPKLDDIGDAVAMYCLYEHPETLREYKVQLLS